MVNTEKITLQEQLRQPAHFRRWKQERIGWKPKFQVPRILSDGTNSNRPDKKNQIFPGFLPAGKLCGKNVAEMWHFLYEKRESEGIRKNGQKKIGILI